MAATTPNITSSHLYPKQEWKGKGRKEGFFLPKGNSFSQRFPFISHWPNCVSWPPLAVAELRETLWKEVATVGLRQSWVIPLLSWQNGFCEERRSGESRWRGNVRICHWIPFSPSPTSLPRGFPPWKVQDSLWIFQPIYIYSRHLAIFLFFHTVRATILLGYSLFEGIKNKSQLL